MTSSQKVERVFDRNRRMGVASGLRMLLRTCTTALLVVTAMAGCGDAASELKPKVEQHAVAGEANPVGTAASAAARTATSADGTYRVSWEPVGGVIPDAEPFAISIKVERLDGAPLAADTTVLVDAEMPHHGHGMNLVPVVNQTSGAGTFVAEGMLLHMSGAWVVAIDVGEDGVSERAQWIIDVE